MLSERSWNWLAVLVALLVAGCSSTPDQSTTDGYDYGDYQPYDESVESQQSVQDNKIVLKTGNPGVRDLWEKAETARQNGNLDSAEQSLERALRLEPESAIMWSRLAEIQLRKQNANQAENLAAKSNTLSVDTPLLNYRNWLIIAKARQMQGDDIGAQEAEYTANSFRP